MKGTTIFQLLQILSEETDADHKLSAQELMQRLNDRFHIKPNRRTLKGYLDDLIQAGYPLNCTVRTRNLPDGTVESMSSDWYMDAPFEVSELRLLIDLLHEVPTLPESQRETLVQKLIKYATPSFQKTVSEAKILYLTRPPAQQLLYSVDVLCEAISKNCMVQFQYCQYTLDENEVPALTPCRKTDGTIRQYFVSPYQIVVSHGNYYLICCKEPYRQVSYYRIDRISEISLKEDFPRQPFEDLEKEAPLPTIQAESLYMYGGKQIDVTFRADEKILSHVVDWFGEQAEFSREDDDRILVRVKVNPDAMKHWTLQYGESVEILTPPDLRESVAESARRIYSQYANAQTES